MTSKNKQSLQNAGRKGGTATAATHDKEFYQEIGHMGGEARSEHSSSSSRIVAQKKETKSTGSAEKIHKK